MEKRILLFLCLLAVAAVPAWSAMTPLDSAGFATKFECDSWPSPDFPNSLGSPTVNGDSTISYVCSTSTVGEWDAPSLPESYTIEWKMQIHSSNATYGAFVVSYYTNDLTAPTILTSLGADYFMSYDGSGFPKVSTGDNTDGMHVFRIAHDNVGNPGQLSIWKDGVSLGTLATANADWDATAIYFMGGWSVASGTGTLDYYRWTSGAYSPVPEPLSLALLALGGWFVRKRG